MTDLTLSGNYTSGLPPWARYDGSPLLKKAFVKIKYTEFQIEEIIKCSEDIVYFAENYITIVDPNKGKTIVKLRDYQKRLLKHFNENRFTILLSPRQIGKSLSFAIYLTWYSLFNKDKKSMILANKYSTAKEIFSKVKLAYERLPHWLQVGVTEWNVMSLTLENGCSISCAATSSDGIRGLSINGILVLDEFAFLRRTVAEDFFTSVYPTISASLESKIIIVSTPNGLNHFADIWKKAEKGKNSFKPFKVDWTEVPDRNAAWMEKTKEDVGAQKFRQEYLAEFLGSTNTLISVKTLENLESEAPIDTLEWGLKIFEHPKQNHIYIIGVDTAKGTGGNYSVTQVLDISAVPIKQVAVYSDNTIGTYNFSYLIEKIAKLYNSAYLSIENNAEGAAVLQTLWNEIEYENIIDFETNKKELGIRATVKTKSHALDILKDYLENKKIEIKDIQTIYELSRFVDHGNGRFSAEEGENDDFVSALYWALFITSIPEYFEKNEMLLNVKKEENNAEVGEEPMIPFIDEEDTKDDFQKELLQ